MIYDTIALRPNGKRAQEAVYALYVSGAIQLALIMVSGLELYLLGRIEAGDWPSDVLIEGADTAYAALSVAYLVSLAVGGVLFIRWFRRGYYNLHLLPVRVRHGEGWAAGAWFVPFMNLFRPYQIMKELHVKGAHLLHKHPEVEALPAKTENVGIWWALWIIYNIVGRIAARASDDLESIEGLQLSFQFDVALYGLGVLTAGVAIVVVRQYAAIEDRLRRAFASDQARIIDSFVPAKL